MNTLLKQRVDWSRECSLVCYTSSTIVIVNSSDMYIITSTCIMIMHNIIQSEIVSENAWQTMFMIHEFMNEQ